ncbi:hypothetical protein BGY98DRAFT_76997 [Russula aff. rugulosa BPL654]|nr:hypothetical protein BGY98DRAFT_76997 [Russula aff. rugulosa BPL654]
MKAWIVLSVCITNSGFHSGAVLWRCPRMMHALPIVLDKSLYYIWPGLTVCLLAVTNIHRLCDMGPTKHRFLTPIVQYLAGKKLRMPVTLMDSKCGAGRVIDDNLQIHNPNLQ